MRPARTFYLLLQIFSLCLLVSCGDAASSVQNQQDQQTGDAASGGQCREPSALMQTEAQFFRREVLEDAELGSGVSLVRPGEPPAVHGTCVALEEEPRLTWLAHLSYWGDKVDCHADIYERFLVPLAEQGHWSPQQLAQIEAVFTDYYSQKPDATLQVVARTFLTATRSAQLGADTDGGRCANAPDDGALQWYADNCGDHFIGSELLGGVVIAFADLEGVSGDLYDDLNAVLTGTWDADDEGEDASGCAACRRVADAGVDIGMITIGFPGPNEQPPGAFAAVDPQTVETYMDSHIDKATQAFNDRAHDSSALGGVVEQRFRAYDTLDARRCLGDEAVPGAYYDATVLKRRAAESFALIEPLRAMIDYRLDHPELHVWPEPAAEAEHDLLDARDQLDDCASRLDTALARCDAALDGGDLDEACEEPDGCGSFDIESIYDELPEVSADN